MKRAVQSKISWVIEGKDKIKKEVNEIKYSI